VLAWLLSLFVAVPLGLLGAAILWAWLADAAERRRFCARRAGEVFLLWDTRRGWHDFVQNNVLPVLPAGVVPSARGRKRRTNARYDQEPWRHLPWLPWQRSGSAPCLLVVEADGTRVIPLRDALLALKSAHGGKSSDQARAKVRAALGPALRALPERSDRAVGGLLTPAAAPASR
jgi:hypothetical protein